MNEKIKLFIVIIALIASFIFGCFANRPGIQPDNDSSGDIRNGLDELSTERSHLETIAGELRAENNNARGLIDDIENDNRDAIEGITDAKRILKGAKARSDIPAGG